MNNTTASVSNITALLPDNEDLQISENHREEILDAICRDLDANLAILDKDLNYIFLSESVYRNFDLSKDTIRVGINVSEMHDALIAGGLLTKEIVDDTIIKPTSGSMLEGDKNEPNNKILRFGNGKLTKFYRKDTSSGLTLSIAEDVTDSFNKSEMLEKALFVGDAAYWTYDFKSKEYQMSRSMRSFYGDDIATVLEKKGILATIYPDDRDIYKQALKNLPKTDDKFEVQVRCKNGNDELRWCRSRAELVRDPNGNPLKLLVFAKDIEEDKQQEDALKKAKDEAIAGSKAKSEFLANMSHEIRTPMNGILGMAELLKSTDIDEKQTEFVNIINNSAKSLLTIINDILDFSKIEAGAMTMDPMPFDLKSDIHDVMSLLSKKAQEKELELIVDYPTHAHSNFIGDSGRIRQVLTNLLGNAIKFTSEGYVRAKVNISEPQNNRCVISVGIEDTGIGIPADKLKHIFDKFTQADGSTTRLYGGTGLGLAISKSIVEMMDGSVSVSSDSGQGSTFSMKFSLPIDVEAEKHVFDTSKINGKTALIVDDIDASRHILTKHLKNWGMNAVTAANADEGFAQLQEYHANGTPFDIIVVDNTLPEMSGEDWIKTISNSAYCPPTILLSCGDQSHLEESLSNTKVTSYHAKPIKAQKLCVAITEALPDATDVQNFALKPKLEKQEESNKADIKKCQGNECQTHHILVAEDTPLNQDVVRLMLDGSCYLPDFFDNGKLAFEAYKANPEKYKMVVMDISMPVMDGYEASRQIRSFEKDSNLSAIPIIALTGHALKHDKQICLEAGMDDYLTKPVKQIELYDRLEFHARSKTACSTPC